MSEGYTKFNCKRIEKKLTENISEINQLRKKLYSLKLIGAHEDGVGYGNISIRNGKGFLISGTKTGGIERLTKKHYTQVTDWDYKENNLTCVGPIDASSESLTHGAVYEADSEINAVIHIHNLELWARLIFQVPTTSMEVEYGTPRMAEEIFRLFRETKVKEKKILVMGGHPEGIISFGKDLDEAGRILLNYF
ncbi:L-fuculose phosphate aldolase [uncultured archaeon]|nr:L-fuculose phosphate aldolase [uncultured archaeon]